MTDTPTPPARPGAVHRSAATGYSSAADTYESGRPDYPAATDTWLCDVVGVRAGRTVLEIGAGAGAFTTRLTATGARVYAVEPVRAMRVKLAARAPDAGAIAGVADGLPLRDGFADAIVCAQSFHWFATAATLREFRRVLAPDGVLALIWNVRDEREPWVRRLSAITDPLEDGTPRYRTGDWQRAFDGSGLVEVDRREIDHAHTGTVDRVVMARTLSVSFIAALPDAARQQLEDRLRRFVQDEPALAGTSTVTFPYRTTMYAYRRSADRARTPDEHSA